MTEMMMSPADLKAVTSTNEGTGMNSWFWIIVLFLFRGGLFGGGEGTPATAQSVQNAFDTQTVISKLDGINSGLCDGFYAQNTTLLQGFNAQNIATMQGFNATQAGIADLGYKTQACCCETNRNIDSVKFENAKNTCDIIISNDKNTQRILDAMKQNEIDTLRTQLQTVQLSASNIAQTQEILGNLGRYYPLPPVNPCCAYGA